MSRSSSRNLPATSLWLLWMALALNLAVGILGRGYWTPDEPREADIAWRMSWQAEKSVPLLAGEAFCEKPPFAYWVAGAAIAVLGADAWAARLPNLLYALATALAVGCLARRSAGPVAGAAAAAAISTLLLPYQVAIWLATDAPLLAAVAVALLGLYTGFYAEGTGQRLRGYSCMHLAMAVGFLSKSAAAWMVPVLTIATLVIWERRWRELLRWELYIGLAIQAAVILTWVGVVYAGPEGSDHIKVFFWNNLAGRFAQVEAPEELQYAAAHRNSPGKYLIELPVYLWPWTLLVAAAIRHAWRQRHLPDEQRRPVRFATATFIPTLIMLSVAATARNIYLAPAFPGVALLLGWWTAALASSHDRWDRRAVPATALLLGLAASLCAAALCIIGFDSWETLSAHTAFVSVSLVGLICAAAFATTAWRTAGRTPLPRALLALLLAYSALLAGPASQIYRGVDTWQNLSMVGRQIEQDAAGRDLVLYASDETTRAFVDMYARTSVEFIPGPITAATAARLNTLLDARPHSLVVTQMPGRNQSPTLQALEATLGLGRNASDGGRPVNAPPNWAAPPDWVATPAWAAPSHLHVAHLYALPNGRRYALLERPDPAAAR
jgi:4-amino-4-deoxy-L-arabinose transferase-like glycosyltransferase